MLARRPQPGENAAMRSVLGTALVLLLIGNAFAQQIGSIDLTRPAKHEDLPHSCKNLVPGIIADGWAGWVDHVRRQIMVEVVSVEDMNPDLGSELTAEVRLRNSGTLPIVIPWSTEFSTVVKGQNPDALKWVDGWFEFTLKDQQNNEVSLKSLTGVVYGSESSAGTELTIKPGENVTALVRFALEDEFPIAPPRLKEGQWELSSKWLQNDRGWSIGKNCSVSNYYNHYDWYYEQQSPAITIQIKAGAPTKSRKTPE